ncbi:MAG: hypothetical protein WC614_12370 [bacterium]
MAQISIMGKTYEVSDEKLIQLLGARSQSGSTQAGNYPVSSHDEYSIRTCDGEIAPTEIQKDLGNGIEALDFNDGRNVIKENTWHSYR